MTFLFLQNFIYNTPPGMPGVPGKQYRPRCRKHCETRGGQPIRNGCSECGLCRRS